MLQLPNLALSARSQGYMNKWQRLIDAEPSYEEQILKAKEMWPKSNKTFDEIKDKLRLMSNGTKRCNYCEDSYADEIEHIYPKSIYPDRTFVWENYLYACGPCNGPKNNKFALIPSAGILNDITPPRRIPAGYVYTRPSNDQIALIDPRVENPFNFLELDIFQTFRFVPAHGLNNQALQRARYTIDVLRLNEREYLIKAREHAYDDFKSRLIVYIQERDKGVSKVKLDKLIEGIKDHNHPTVWHEMKRFRTFIPDLNQLFSNAPEAINW